MEEDSLPQGLVCAAIVAAITAADDPGTIQLVRLVARRRADIKVLVRLSPYADEITIDIKPVSLSNPE